MPRRPQLAAPVTRGGQLSAEPPGWLGNISTLLGWLLLLWQPPSSMGPLTTGWAPFHTRCGGLCPLGLAGRGGF
jgi:hypothetical protein